MEIWIAREEQTVQHVWSTAPESWWWREGWRAWEGAGCRAERPWTSVQRQWGAPGDFNRVKIRPSHDTMGMMYGWRLDALRGWAPCPGGMQAGEAREGGRQHGWAQIMVSESLPNLSQWLQETPTGPRSWLSIPWLLAGVWIEGMAG